MILRVWCGVIKSKKNLERLAERRCFYRKAFYMQILIEPLVHPYLREIHFSEADIKSFATYAACPACGASADFERLVKLGQPQWQSQMQVVQCKNCEHLFYANPPGEEWFANFYRSEWNSDRGENVNAKLTASMKVRSTSASLLADAAISTLSARILEIGCGPGDMLAGLQQAGFNDLYGTEASDYRAAMSALRFPQRVFRGGYSVVPAELKFDFIFSHHVMEHIYNPRQAMAWMVDHLNSNGAIAITVPNSAYEPILNQILFIPHLHSFSHHSLRKMGESLGLETIFWKGANIPYEITAVFHRSSEPQTFGSKSWFDPGPNDVAAEQPMKKRFERLARAGKPGDTVQFVLHTGEKGAVAIQAFGGLRQIGAIPALLARFSTRLGRGITALGFRHAGNKWLGRLRVVTAHLKEADDPIPVIGSTKGDLALHIK